MAVIKQNVTYFNFSGGLNTEASPVNIEPDDSTDISNIKLNRDGSIEPRSGIDFISEMTAGGFYDTETADYSLYDEVPSVHPFTMINSVGNTVNMVAMHIGDEIRLYEYTNLYSLKEIATPVITFDLSAYSVEQRFYKTRFIQSRNRLFVINKYIKLQYIKLESDSSWTINVTEVYYRNIGAETDTPVDTYINESGKNYKCIETHWSNVPSSKPGVGSIWERYWVVNGAEDSNYDNWATGQNYKSNVEAITLGTAKGWRDGCLSSGRLWLTGVGDEVNTIYFSQTIVDDAHHTRMYQFADPYNLEDPDTVDTDGGTITITECHDIISIAPFRNGVLVFGSNGVWYISGSAGITFKATDFSVDKLSDDGITGKDCWVAVEHSVIYFGVSSVFAIQLQDGLSAPQVTSLSIDKIESFYNSIPFYNKEASNAVYNAIGKKLLFFTNFSTYDWMIERNKYAQSTHNRDVLIYDFKINAWYKYSLADDEAGTKVAISDSIIVRGGDITFDVLIDNSGNLIEDSLGNLVEAYSSTAAASDNVVITLLTKQSTTDVKFAFGLFESSSSQDFVLNATDTETVDCYIDTAHQIFGDIAFQKQSPYVTTLFKRVENGILGDDGIDTNAGGCLYRVNFDWANSTKAFKYGTARQAYLPNKWNISYENGSDPGYPVVRNKHRIRGKGSAIQLRFENDETKPFKLYGWQLELNLLR